MKSISVLVASPFAMTRPRDVMTVYRDHADFVWRSLQRLGVRESDLEDVFQEVFVVVQNRLSTFEEHSKLTTWLYGICLRVASAHRRRAYLRREVGGDDLPEPPSPGMTPEHACEMRQASRTLAAVLASMDLDKRAVFAMFEIDELSSEQIAEILGVPVGTVHSRLHAARGQFRKRLATLQARDRTGDAP